MSGWALFALVCGGGGFLAGWIACWTAGLFRYSREPDWQVEWVTVWDNDWDWPEYRVGGGDG